MVAAMLEQTTISERRGCLLVGLSRIVLHYQGKAQPENEQLQARMAELTGVRRRFGYRPDNADENHIAISLRSIKEKARQLDYDTRPLPYAVLCTVARSYHECARSQTPIPDFLCSPRLQDLHTLRLL